MDTTDVFYKRSIKELLQILLDNMNLLTSGLCSLAPRLNAIGKLTDEEVMTLWRYIEEHQPYNLYYILSKFSDSTEYIFYWEKGKKKPRINWLKKQIKSL